MLHDTDDQYKRVDDSFLFFYLKTLLVNKQ